MMSLESPSLYLTYPSPPAWPRQTLHYGAPIHLRWVMERRPLLTRGPSTFRTYKIMSCGSISLLMTACQLVTMLSGPRVRTVRVRISYRPIARPHVFGSLLSLYLGTKQMRGRPGSPSSLLTVVAVPMVVSCMGLPLGVACPG